MMVEHVIDEVKEMPPSAKLVFRVLQWEGELTQQQLVEETTLPDCTVRHALAGLEEHGIIEKRFSFFLTRKRLYSIRPA